MELLGNWQIRKSDASSTQTMKQLTYSMTVMLIMFFAKSIVEINAELDDVEYRFYYLQLKVVGFARVD